MAWVPLPHLSRGPTSLGIPTTLMDCEPSYSCQIRRLRLAPSESSHGRKRAKLSVLLPMSAFGPKRTSLVAPHMSAFGPKRTSLVAPHMSAFDPKRTSSHSSSPFKLARQTLDVRVTESFGIGRGDKNYT